MAKLISSINMTLDGFCDHTAVIADDELQISERVKLKLIESKPFKSGAIMLTYSRQK